MDETVLSDNKESKPWLFKKGDPRINREGRPKGSISLKTYAKQYLQGLSDEEKIEFMEGLPKEVIWKMAEGNPTSDDTVTVVTPNIHIAESIATKYDTPTPSTE